MDLLSCFPAEWQDDYKRRLEASKTRKFRAMQDAAIETAKKGQMRFDVKGRSVLVIVTLGVEKLASADKGKSWYIVNSKKTRLLNSEAIQVLRERFNYQWPRYINSQRGGKIVRTENIAAHWGDTGKRVLSFV